MSEQTQQQEGLKEPLQLLTLEQHVQYIEAMCREILDILKQQQAPQPAASPGLTK